MRLLLKLSPIESVQNELNYHYAIQGFIYELLRDSIFREIHDKQGYKFFCYSNIFPFEHILNKSRIYNLLISSPNWKLMESIYKKLVVIEKIKIHNMKFSIKHVESLEIKIPNEPFIITTGTPIVIRIRKESIDGISDLKKDYEYFYWRSTFPIENFINQVTSNLVKKYTEYNCILDSEKVNKEELFSKFSLFFQKFKYKKQVSNVVNIKGTSHIIIGSIWEFGFEGWEDKDLIKFAMDCGLGERNSLGFGFLNLVNRPSFF